MRNEREVEVRATAGDRIMPHLKISALAGNQTATGKWVVMKMIGLMVR